MKNQNVFISLMKAKKDIFTDDYKMLSEAYNEFCNKYEWAPKGGHILSLMKNNNMINLNEYASLAENGINDGDKICVINN